MFLNIGGSARFKYKLPHENAPIEWIHNGKRIYPENDPQKYQIIADGLNRTLIIKDLRPEEQGTLGVKIAEKVTTAKLQVQALKDVSEHIGGSATFKYKMPHADAPIEWIHNGKRIYPEKDPQKYQVVSDGLTKTLIIKDLKEEEQGTIGVKIGEKTSTAKLQVQALKDVSERIGGSATFKYKLPHEGAPIEWTHNGKRIYPEKEPHKYEIVSDGLNRTLVIKNLKIEEQGSIGVKIADKVSSAKLQVQGAGEDLIAPATAQPTQTAARRTSSTARRVSWGFKGQGFPPTSDGYESGQRSPRGSWRNPDGSMQRPDGAFFAPDGSPLEDPPAKFFEMGIAEPLSGRRSPGGTFVNPDGSLQSPGGKCYSPSGKLLDGVPPGFFEFGVTIPTGCRSPSGFWHNPDGSCQSPGGNCYDPHGKLLDPVPDGFFDVGVCLPKGQETPKGTWKNPDGSCKKPDGTCYDPAGNKLATEPEDFTTYGTSLPGTTQYLNLVAHALTDFREKGKEKGVEPERAPLEPVQEVQPSPSMPTKASKPEKPIVPTAATDSSSKPKVDPVKPEVPKETPPVIVKGLDEFMTGLGENEVTLEATVDKDHRKKSGEPIEGEWSATKKGAAPRVLRPSYKYHMSQNDNVYALTIKDLMFEDEGVYTFKFEGHETHCKLKVDEAPVVFTKPLSRINAKEKDDVTLECEANKVKWKLSGKDIDFSWKKGDARMDETGKVKFEKQGRKLMLVMKKISLNDASEYSCNAGEGPTASKTIGGIEVQELPLGFDEGLKDLEKTEGETAVLEAVINRPGADVLWFKDGKKIDFSDPRFEQKQDKDGRIQLIIKPCVMDDEATYEAKVGTKKTSCKFRVKEGPVVFTRPLADMSVKEGAPAILHAEVNKMRYQQSGAAVNITWYRNDIPISKNDECHLYCTIKKIAMDDTGSNYSVTADTAKTAGTLSVTEEPLYFVEKLKDTPLKKIPSTITLSCKLNKPGVPVQWLKDGMPIKIDGDKYDVKEEDGKHILIILDCNGDDEGKYTCKPKDVTCDCQLQVKAAPTLDITDEVRTIKAGTATTFEIPYTGHPVPTVTWSHKMSSLDQKRRRSEHVPGKLLKLIIKDSVRADSGSYNVVVENDHGRADGVVKLNVLDIPGPPRNLGFREVFSDRIVVEWDCQAMT